MSKDCEVHSQLIVGNARWPALTARFELSREGSSANLRPMEGLRGLAVFLVFIVHYVTLSMPWIPEGSALLPFATALHSMGNVGVDLFFVLSGYLIYGSLIARSPSYGQFMWRRIVRIYPTFTVVFVIYLVLSVLFPAENKIPRELAQAVPFVLANFLLLPGLFPIQAIITVAWSLSYEIFFYLTMPLVIAVLGLRRWSGGRRVWLFGLASVLGLWVFLQMGGPIRMLMFIAGMVLHEWLQHRPRTSGRSMVGVGCLVLALAISATMPMPGRAGAAIQVVAVALMFMVVCHAAFSDTCGPLARGLSWTALRWLGNMSYSYYLIHGLALKAWFMVLTKVWPLGAGGAAGMFWWNLPVAFALTCIPSALLFLWIERPLSLDVRRSQPTQACA